jgi:hypothetical protein
MHYLNLSKNNSINSVNTSCASFWRISKYLNRDDYFPLFRVYQNGPGVGKYLRPSSIGFSNIDLTLSQSPAFSFGKGMKFLIFSFEFIYINLMTKKLLDGLIQIALGIFFHQDQSIVQKQCVKKYLAII